MLGEVQVKEVDEVLGKFCRREPPRVVRSELEYALRVDGHAVTLVELRLAFRAEIGRTETLVARFRFVAATSLWQLFWRDRNSRWHCYPGMRPNKRLAKLFVEVRRDPSGIFWG